MSEARRLRGGKSCGASATGRKTPDMVESTQLKSTINNLTHTAMSVVRYNLLVPETWDCYENQTFIIGSQPADNKSLG